eukprot:PLAT9901.1.p1 GENE.PLAT9901.1~~PLAT9901.1.p1  ORF type:complete len:405 (+),score=202.42 PLAT9901.1:346-1560(+)
MRALAAQLLFFVVAFGVAYIYRVETTAHMLPPARKPPARFRPAGDVLVDESVCLLDIAFVLDATGSMSPYLAAVQRQVGNIMGRIRQSHCSRVRFALIAYRDHVDDDMLMVTDFVDSTRSDLVHSAVNALSATGGGDEPEAMADALFAAQQLSWSKDATRVVLLVTDAPPHGLPGLHSRDEQPNGCPLGHDPLVAARALAADGTFIFPALAGRGSHVLRVFLATIAQMSGGQALSLKNAGKLPEVIFGSLVEAMEMEELDVLVEKEAKRLEAEYGAKLTAEQLAKDLMPKLQKRKSSGLSQLFSSGFSLKHKASTLFTADSLAAVTAADLADEEVEDLDEEAESDSGAAAVGADSMERVAGVAHAVDIAASVKKAEVDEQLSLRLTSRYVAKRKTASEGASDGV